jgi:hypothetical protein
MTPSLLLSQSKLNTFLTCQRRFQLLYLRRLPWPILPPDGDAENIISRGQQFHQVMERHFLGLDIPPETIADDHVRRWWRAFQSRPPAIPSGKRLPEHRLTVPIGAHLLLGRFDLLVTGEADGRPFAHVYDWKTGKGRRESDLRQDWQTRLYLALLAEGGAALLGNGRSLSPTDIAITYWYANEPDAPRTIAYSAAWHAQNWADIQAIVAQIDDSLAQNDWPLTANWDECRRCAYQVYCGRQAAGPSRLSPHDDAEAPDEVDFLDLEPQTP